MNDFIKQTAVDYGMNCKDVEDLYKNQPTNVFYDKLEEHIKTRNETNNKSKPRKQGE